MTCMECDADLDDVEEAAGYRLCMPCAEGPERVTGPALRYRGTIYSLPSPASHRDVERAERANGVSRFQCEEGFMTSSGRFVDRQEAGKVAFDADQISPRPRSAPWSLQSTDLR